MAPNAAIKTVLSPAQTPPEPIPRTAWPTSAVEQEQHTGPGLEKACVLWDPSVHIVELSSNHVCHLHTFQNMHPLLVNIYLIATGRLYPG